MTNHTNLIERLNRTKLIASAMLTEVGTASFGDAKPTLVNPDGPEAAQAISTLTAEVEGLLNRLDELKVAGRPLRHMDIRLGLSMKKLRATLTKGEGDKT